MSLEIEDLTPAIGSVIHAIDLSDAAAVERHGAALRQALLDRQVIFFRNQALSPASQVRLAKLFGDVRPLTSTFAAHPDSEYIEVLEPKGKHTATDCWHADMTFQKTPPLAACLYAVNVPSAGGDTLWASMTAAHDAIAPALREYLTGIEGVHNWERPELLYNINAKDDAKKAYAQMREANPPMRHPVIKTHPETGKKVLFVNDFYTTELVGMTRSESDSLLRYLKALAMVPEYQVRFRWAAGSVAIWDNRAVQHYAVNDYYPAPRKMHRITIYTPAAA